MFFKFILINELIKATIQSYLYMQFQPINLTFNFNNLDSNNHDDIFEDSLSMSDIFIDTINKRQSLSEKTESNFIEEIYDQAEKRTQTISQKEQNTQNQRSIHHNFQKHTVTTLKKVVSLIHLNSSNSESIKIAIKMWQIFEESGSKTKQILSILFGSFSSIDSEIIRYKQSGFGEIISQFPDYLIRQAQDKLRQVTSEQLNSIKLDKHLSKRRMQNKQNFKLYLRCFCQQLLEGPLKQRLGKSKAKKIANIVQCDKYYDLF